jgi:hypothetical protein
LALSWRLRCGRWRKSAPLTWKWTRLDPLEVAWRAYRFIRPGRPLLGQYALIGATLVFTDLVVMAGCTALAWRRLAALKSARQVRWTNRVFGTLFVVAGALLATFKRAQYRRQA